MPRPAVKFQLLLETFSVFLKLGVISFGGPIAHLAYFRKEFVERRKWLSEQAYAELVALCQFLPGPASSQVGFAIGLKRAGLAGAFAAWLAFTTPSVVFLILFALGLRHYGEFMPPGIIEGLKIVAVAVVAQAVLTMGHKLCPDKQRLSIMIVCALCLALSAHTQWLQLLVIIVAAIVGIVIYCNKNAQSPTVTNNISDHAGNTVSSRFRLVLPLFIVLLLSLPLLAELHPNTWTILGNIFFRAGALVFGGGHVVLPMLEAELVPQGWVSAEQFIAGYGAAQTVPGPLFSFAAYLGATMGVGHESLLLALFALVAIFAPGFLLLLGVLPRWEQLKENVWVQAGLKGVNAAVVGILLAALYDPLIKNAVHDLSDVSLVAVALALLIIVRAPLLLIVFFTLVLSYAKTVLFL